MACYNFCQQCKNYFATAGAKKPNRIFFAAFFLLNCISFRWQQHKQKLDNETLVLPTGEKFKTFLHKKLSNSRIFVNSFQRLIKQNAQYQQENVINQTAHLKYLQVVLKKFDPVVAPNKEVLIWYFRKSLRLFIQAQIDSRYPELNFQDKVLDKAIKTKSKAVLQSSTSI